MPFRKRQRPDEPVPSAPPEDLVRLYLKGQNLEQMHRWAEAIDLYEQAVSAGFDSAGPYDRLLYIYRDREDNQAIIRVAVAALERVRTHDAKRAWYEEMQRNAEERLRAHPDPRGAEF